MSTHLSIPKTKKGLRERGLPKDSYFHAVFADNSVRTEHDTDWEKMSELKRVQYIGGTKSVRVSAHKLKHIKLFHEEHKIEMDVPDDCEVYQAIRAETIFKPNGERVQRIHGRVVGLVREGEVVEERFINSLQNVVVGFRK